MPDPSGSRHPPVSPPAVNGGKQDSDVIRTKVLLLGMRRSGKTSIRQVLFNNLPPRDTFYLETTTQLTKHTFDTVIPLEIWDCPGDTTFETLGVPLSQFATMIFVIDIQDLYQQSIAKMVDFIVAAYQESPSMNLEVFVHKADVLSEEYKIENFRLTQQRVLSELAYISPEFEQIPVNFQLTSIYDHSLHDAFSRVLHKLIDSLPYLEDLLNVFCANSQATKSFLFDITSRLYVATDFSPVDPPTHNLCNDYLRTLNALGPLYRSITASPPRMRTLDPTPSVPPSAAPSVPASPRPALEASMSSSSFLSSPASAPTSNPTSPSLLPSPSLPQQLTPSPSTHNGDSNHAVPQRNAKMLFYPSASASLSPSAAGAGTTLTYHLITSQLALLALIPTAVFESRRGLVEYNVVFFREGVQEICEVEDEARRVAR